MTLTSLAMIVHLLKLALLVKTKALVALWMPVTLGTLVRLPSLVIKRDEHLWRNYFGFINILLANTVTFVGHLGCEQHHRASIQLLCVSTGMSISFLMHAYMMLPRRMFSLG